MYFNENEMLEICKKYGIEVIDKNNPDYYKDESFSMTDIMNEPYIHTILEKNIFSKTMEITITFEDDLGFCNNSDSSFSCSVSKDVNYDNVSSVIDKDNGINKAA